jgi:hypothetical protein
VTELTVAEAAVKGLFRALREGLATFVALLYIFVPNWRSEMRKQLIWAMVVTMSCAGWAQQTTKKDGKPAKKMTAAAPAEAGPPIPKPSPEIEKLHAAMTGRWKVTGKIQDENWAKGGDEGAGTEITKKGPGGFSSVSDAQMKWKKIGPMVGHGVVWWDEGKKAYQGLWCDNGGPTCQMSGEGKWDGDKLVFNGEMAMGPQTLPMRQTYSNFSDKGFEWSMEVGDGKGSWKPEMSLKYEKELVNAKNEEMKPKN